MLCCSWPCPRSPALPCPVSLGFSFTPDLEKCWRKSWDTLDLHERGAAEIHQLFISPSDSQRGRITMASQSWERGMASAMPGIAFTLEAERRQRKRGKL